MPNIAERARQASTKLKLCGGTRVHMNMWESSSNSNFPQADFLRCREILRPPEWARAYFWQIRQVGKAAVALYLREQLSQAKRYNIRARAPQPHRDASLFFALVWIILSCSLGSTFASDFWEQSSAPRRIIQRHGRAGKVTRQLSAHSDINPKNTYLTLLCSRVVDTWECV